MQAVERIAITKTAKPRITNWKDARLVQQRPAIADLGAQRSQSEVARDTKLTQTRCHEKHIFGIAKQRTGPNSKSETNTRVGNAT